MLRAPERRHYMPQPEDQAIASKEELILMIEALRDGRVTPREAVVRLSRTNTSLWHDPEFQDRALFQ